MLDFCIRVHQSGYLNFLNKRGLISIATATHTIQPRFTGEDFHSSYAINRIATIRFI